MLAYQAQDADAGAEAPLGMRPRAQDQVQQHRGVVADRCRLATDAVIPYDIDLTIDGADEVDPAMGLIKCGGALLREKVVAQASRREVIVVDESKLSPKLGTHRALPVEVLEFGWRSQARFLESLGAVATLRGQVDGPYRTDRGNMILDCRFGPIADALALASELQARAGIIEHGLFLRLAQEVIVAGSVGVRHVRRGEPMPTPMELPR